MEFDFTDPEFIANPWPVYEMHREDGGVAWVPKVGCYVLTSYAAVRSGLTGSKLSANYPLRASRRLLGPNLLDTEGNLHRILKQVVTPFLSMDAVRRLKDTAVSQAIGEVEQFLYATGERARFDLVSDVAERVPYLVMADILGFPRADLRWLFNEVRPIVEALDYPLPESSDAAERAKDIVTQYCHDRLDGQAAEANMTIRGSLSRLVAAGDLDSEKALSSLLLMIIAASETSISAIANVSYRLLASGWETDTDIGRYVDESLRLDPPLHSVLRFATDDWNIGD
ncbi:MAG: cytochrome P450, partial [Trebonia sp.]